MYKGTKFAIFLALGLAFVLAATAFAQANEGGVDTTATTTTIPEEASFSASDPARHESLQRRDAAAFRQVQIEKYVAAIEEAKLIAYVEAIERAEAEEKARQEAAERAEQERREREAAAAAEAQEKATTAASAPSAPRHNASGSCGGWESLIAKHFSDVATACRVMMCESGGNPNAVNGNPKYGASGLFQIIKQWAERFQQVTGLPYYDGRFDPNANVMFAAYLVNAEGWASQFDCY